MRKLFQFLIKYLTLWLFLFFVGLGSFLVVKRSAGEVIFPFNTSKSVFGPLYQYIDDIKRYFSLSKANLALVEENAALRQQLFNHTFTINQLKEQRKEVNWAQTEEQPYAVIPAKVINNSLVYTRNYLTINKGARHGILPGMGVMMDKGVVGKIREVSDHFSTVVSLLHIDIMLSAKVASSNTLGTVSWQGGDPTEIQLLYVPRYVPIQEGEQVVTSGYGAIFPENIQIGTVKEVQTKESDLFHHVTLTIQTPFHALRHVYVVKNFLKKEKDGLEQSTRRLYE